MTPSEFNAWFREHTAAFPSIGAWIDKMPADQQQGLMRVWRNVLADVPLSEAKEATLRIARGDDEPPRMFDDTPKAIRIHANRLRFAASVAAPVYVGGRRKVTCKRCEDRGYVSVWHPALCEHLYRTVPGEEPITLAVLREQSWWLEWHRSGRPKTWAVLCDCAAGERIAEAKRERKEPVPPMLRDGTAVCDYDNLNDARQAGKPQAVSVYDF